MHESLNRDSGMTEGREGIPGQGPGERWRKRERSKRKGERVCVMTIVIFVMSGVASSHAFGVRCTLLRSVPHSVAPHTSLTPRKV